MKIHEFQGKNIFKHYGIPIQDGYVINNLADANSLAIILADTVSANSNSE